MDLEIDENMVRYIHIHNRLELSVFSLKSAHISYMRAFPQIGPVSSSLGSYPLMMAPTHFDILRSH